MLQIVGPKKLPQLMFLTNDPRKLCTIPSLSIKSMGRFALGI